MNELTTTQTYLPETIPDLKKFILIGREKLAAVRAEIRAIDKVGLAKEVHQQKLLEAQEIAEAVTDAEVRMGELLQETDFDKGGRPSDKTSRPQTTSLRDIGISKDQSAQFQLMARHPEDVEKAKAQAKERGEVLSRSAVLKEIGKHAPKKPDRIKAAQAILEATEQDGDVISLPTMAAHKAAEQQLNTELAHETYDIIYTLIRESQKLTEERVKNFCKVYSQKEWSKYLQGAQTVYDAGTRLTELAKWIWEVSN